MCQFQNAYTRMRRALLGSVYIGICDINVLIYGGALD